MQIRRITVDRFRGIERLEFMPGPRTIILGPNNAGKSTVLEALDLLLHHGIGRPRPAPTEIDYFGRDPSHGFSIEAVLGNLPETFLGEVRDYLEGWDAKKEAVVPEPDGDGIEPVVRVVVAANPDFELSHEFAKPEVVGARFSPRLRRQIGWVFDGRARDPGRQLAFYQGGLLDRLFGDIDLDPAVATLHAELEKGAAAINTDAEVSKVLAGLAADLRALGLLSSEEQPQFEAGAISRRELLQALRLGLPGPGAVRIPLSAQGRGAQRLALVAVLLRLATGNTTQSPIGGFEEPEEALEPLRQAQLAQMLIGLADKGGQIFVVTHSPEVVRAFVAEDLLLLDEKSAGREARALRKTLSPMTRQGYERWLDGPVVRALFARIPVLVEGPGDRAVFSVFWRELASKSEVAPADHLGLDPVSCEGSSEQPRMAAILAEAGKRVVAWAEADTPETLKRLENEGHCAAIILHDATQHRQNLEEALAHGASVATLTTALAVLADDRGYAWEKQRDDLVSRSGNVGIAEDARETMKAASSLPDLIAAVPQAEARRLIADALGGKTVSPFEMKGGRQARIVAEALVAAEGVPSNFADALRQLDAWAKAGCADGQRIVMKSSA